MEKQVTDSVATTTTTTAPINIIADEIIRSANIPDGWILRGLLTADNSSRQVATTTTSTANGSKPNLVEGLGDEFFDQEPVGSNDDEIAEIIAEIASMENDVAAVDVKKTAAVDGVQSVATGLHGVEEAAATVLPPTSPLPPIPPSDFNRKADEAAATVLLQTSPLLPTPRPHASRTSSTSSTPGTMSDPEIFSPDIEDRPSSPIILGRKRKFFGAGKGRKMFQLSRKEKGESPSSSSSSSSSSSLHPSQLFSQPDHKALVRDYRNLICQVEEQRRLCQQRRNESQTKLISLISRREEVKTRRTHNAERLRRLLEQFKKLRGGIERLKSKCREDDDLIQSLLDEEVQLRGERDSYQEQLVKYQQRLVALRGVAEFPE